jgi:hypothetical protein
MWYAVPGIRGTLGLGPCTRSDLLKEHAGIDVLAMYPAGAEPTKSADDETWDNLLAAAEKCHSAGFPFGLPLGVTSDSVEWLGAMFRAFGANLVDAQGNITREVRYRSPRASSTQGYPLALSQQGRSGSHHTLCPVASVGRNANIHASHHAQDGPAAIKGRGRRDDAGLSGKRT